MDQMIGRMLDNRYELLELIGSGGMAMVYKAKCHRLNRLVAVKVLKSDFASDADFRRRFYDESQAIAMLSHPNIVSVYDVSRSSPEYIVMELIDGITLKQYMERRGRLNWRESLHFITQIMKGLSHAHSRGIVHRDIKPQNIMVLRDGSVKVADFGIACLANSANTLTQEALGSVHYMSPEQARGDRTDARSDIYSAGVVLYEMLTGRLPFEGDSAVSVAIQHLSSVPLSPREINPDVPEALELICMKAMASELEKRYASADEMLADLEEFRKNPEVDLDFTIEDLHRETVDEPTSYLDVRHKLEFLSILQKLCRERQLTVILSLHELELAEKISDRILCVNGRAVDRIGTPEEVMTDGYITQLYGIRMGSYDEASSDMELAAPEGTPQVFVIAGAGSGRKTYRRLQRAGIPFVTGILYENDLDYPVAKALAAEVIAEHPFEPVAREKIQAAKKTIDKCKRVICCRENFGSLETFQRELLEYAEQLGKQIEKLERPEQQSGC